MIEVTRLNGRSLVVNAELIESVEATPDTIISLHTGRKFVVREPVDEVVRRVIEYRRSIFAHRDEVARDRLAYPCDPPSVEP